MSPTDSRAELAEALANAYLRLLVKRQQKELEDPAKVEALCPQVDAIGNVAGKESP
jgi:hypothetical protein